MKLPEKLPLHPLAGWLRATRETLGQSQTAIAEKLGIKRQAYANFETGEMRSTISLASLRRAAQAMDCDLVYSLVPRTNAASTPVQREAAPPVRKSAPDHFISQADRAEDELPLNLL